MKTYACSPPIYKHIFTHKHTSHTHTHTRGMVRVGSKEFGHEIGPCGVPLLDAQADA